MKLVDMTISDFSRVLASSAPAPGGGSVAALKGVTSAALTAMVCALTVGKKKYAEYEELTVQAQQRANDLRQQFLDAIDRDNEAFGEMGAVFAMPKETEEEKALRQAAMQRALKSCTLPPLETMELCVHTVQLTASLVGKSNASAASDLGVAALGLKAAVQSAWLNVLINVGSIQDESFAAACRQKGEDMLKRTVEQADAVYEQVLSQL